MMVFTCERCVGRGIVCEVTAPEGERAPLNCPYTPYRTPEWVPAYREGRE